MPPLSTHFRFAALVMPRLGLPPNAGLFLLGSIAPDAFEPDSEEGFTQHHFIGQDGKISLATFTQATGFSWRSAHEPGWPLTCGYYAHLWLDVFYRNHGDDLPVRRPNGMSDVDLRLTLRKETEHINSPHFLGTATVPFPWPDGASKPPGLDFIDVERCGRLLQHVLARTREAARHPIQLALIDPAEYEEFLKGASDTFLDKVKTAA